MEHATRGSIGGKQLPGLQLNVATRQHTCPRPRLDCSFGSTSARSDSYGENKEAKIRHYQASVIKTLTIIADREETPIFNMIRRRKVFTVLRLRFMRVAISLLLMPCSRYSNTSRSRCVRLHCSVIFDIGISPEGPRSNNTAI